MRRIQAAGKGVITGDGAHGVHVAKALLQALKPEGLMISVHTQSYDEAMFF